MCHEVGAMTSMEEDKQRNFANKSKKDLDLFLWAECHWSFRVLTLVSFFQRRSNARVVENWNKNISILCVFNLQTCNTKLMFSRSSKSQ